LVTEQASLATKQDRLMTKQRCFIIKQFGRMTEKPVFMDKKDNLEAKMGKYYSMSITQQCSER